MDLGLARPTPAHALTEGAELARETMARLGHEQRLKREVAAIVVEHGHKRLEPYDGPAPAAAKRIARLAAALGFDVIERETPTGHAVEGKHDGRGVGFRAYWQRGKTAGGTWHTRGRDVWKLVDISHRPIGVDARAKTTKAGCRHDVNDRTRLSLVASPRGVQLGITEIERRIKA